jgi:hypothetical protein
MERFGGADRQQEAVVSAHDRTRERPRYPSRPSGGRPRAWAAVRSRPRSA